MRRKLLISFLALLPPLLKPSVSAAQAGVVVIGHSSLDKLDVVMVQRIYTGRVVELAGKPVTPVNTQAGSAVRERFLVAYLQQDEEKYVAYWTVRRYIGKGVPPRELGSEAEVIRFVQATPGAIGYVNESNLAPGLNVLLR